MSDKTGTLTRNVMKFKRCTIAGVDYGNDTSDEFSDPTLILNLNNGNNTQIYDFLLAMSVCHTVVSEKHEEDGSISYQASSPDENALVKGAASQGFIFSERTPNSMSIYAVRINAITFYSPFRLARKSILNCSMFLTSTVIESE